MIRQLNNFISILNPSQKSKFYWYLFSVFLIGIIEITGLITIIPLVNIFLEKDIPQYLNFLTDYIENFDDLLIVDFIVLYIGFVVIFYFLKFIIISISYYFQIKFSFNIQKDISVDILNDFLTKDFFLYSSKSTPMIIRDAVGEVAILSGAIQSYILMFFEFIILFISLFIILYFFDISALFFAIFIFILFYLVFISISKLLKKWGHLRQINEEKRIQILKDSLGSLKEIKFLSLEKKLKDSFSDATKIAYDANAKNIFLKFIPRYAVDFVAILIFFALAIFILNENNFDSFTVYTGILIILMSRVVPSVSRIASYVQNIKFNEVVFENVYDRFKDNQPTELKKLKPTNFKSVEFKNVTFKYIESKHNILDKFNFKISKGEKVLILGESGSGKSTFIDLLIGLQKIKSGEIYYNGNLMKNYSKLQLNDIISYLPQEPYLFNNSLVSNITLLDDIKNVDETRLQECFNVSCISSFINKLPNGKHTFIGEDGAKLSGGQKKRIGIARSIYNLKDIIVLDEPTSNLDENTENQVIKNIISKKDLTIIMVSHKEKFSELFDKTINFNNI